MQPPSHRSVISLPGVTGDARDVCRRAHAVRKVFGGCVQPEASRYCHGRQEESRNINEFIYQAIKMFFISFKKKIKAMKNRYQAIYT